MFLAHLGNFDNQTAVVVAETHGITLKSTCTSHRLIYRCQELFKQCG